MFDLLKKKISSFVNSVTGKAESAKPEPAKEEVVDKPVEKIEETEEIVEERKEEMNVEEAKQTKQEEIVHTPSPKIFGPEEKKQRDIAPKIGLVQKVKSIFSQEIEIGEGEAAPLFEELEVALLESDVSFDTSQQLLSSLRGKIIGMRVNKNSFSKQVRESIKQSFLELFANEPFDFYNFVAAKKNRGEVTSVLFVGPNGAGKTTTIAKLASQLQKRGFSSIIAAGDTFRKAAIEQAVVHGEKLGVRVVKHDYGADPAAVGFDAISAAKAGKVDVVLIDTAGRQETNVNLVKEMQKMERVLKPDLKLFVGEAIAGNALIEQIKKFHEAISLDGVVLTKLDCDAKGGGAFSIAYETKLPLLFVGVGQSYEDLQPFDAEWVVDNVFAA